MAFCLTNVLGVTPMTGKFINHVCDAFFGVLHLFDRKLPTVFVSNITSIGDEVHGCFKVNGNVDDGPDDNDTVADDAVANDVVADDLVADDVVVDDAIADGSDSDSSICDFFVSNGSVDNDSVGAVSVGNGSVGNGIVDDGCVIDDENKDGKENNLASEDFISL